MKKLTYLFLLVALVAVPVSEVFAQRVEFRGTLIITKLTSACGDAGFALGDTATSRFYPGGVGDNVGNDFFTGLSYFFLFFAEGYSFDGAYTELLGGNFIDVRGVGLGRRPFGFDSRMRLTSLKPANLKPGTKFVTMAGKIRDFDGVSGCHIDFRGSFNKRLN